jgi:hypothetical protein
MAIIPGSLTSELLASIRRTHQERRTAGLVPVPLYVGIEKFAGFPHHVAIARHYAETAAALDIQISHVECQQVHLAPVDDHHLAVISHQVVRRSRYRDTITQQPCFQLAQIGLAGAVRMCDQRVHGHPALNRVGHCAFHLALIEAEDEHLHTCFRALNGSYDRRYALSGLDVYLHGWLVHAGSFLAPGNKQATRR